MGWAPGSSLCGLVWFGGGGGPSRAVCGGGRLCSSLHVDMEESKIRKVKSKLKNNVYSFILFM